MNATSVSWTDNCRLAKTASHALQLLRFRRTSPPPLRHTLAPPDTPRLHPLTPYRYHWKASVDQAHSVCDELGYSVKQLIVGSLFTVVIEPWRQYISLHAYIDITRLRSTASHISDLSRPPHILLSTFLFAYLRISALANTFRWIARLTHLCVNV